MSTTKAWTFTRPGPYRTVLRQTTTHPIPTLPPTYPKKCTKLLQEEHLLLRVSHAALNPGDAVCLSVLPALFRSHLPAHPAVPCFDLTGTVLDTYSPSPTTTTTATKKFKKGDKIVAFLPLSHQLATGAGGLQGTLALPARFCVPLPEGKTERDAAGLLLCGCTADVMVREARVEKGQRVLVIGASGGVGTMVVQMVREVVEKEGYVVGVCSGRNRELVEGLGVDEVIDYTQYTDLPGELARRYGDQPFDCVLDSFGNQAVYKQSARFLKPRGIYEAASVHYDRYTFWELLKSGLTLMSNAALPQSPWLGGTGRTWKAASMMDPGQEMMERVVKLFGEGKLRVVVDSEWPFEKVHEALDILYSGHAAGKVIIKVDDE